MELTASNSRVEGISQTLRSYLKCYFKRVHGLQDRLDITARSTRTHLLIHATTETGAHNSNPFKAKFAVSLIRAVSREVLRGICRDFVAIFIPRERVCKFGTSLPTTQLEDLLVAMPNVETLRLFEARLSEGFLLPSLAGSSAKMKLLPSLRRLRLKYVTLNDNSWRPLIKYLVHQTSDGQEVSLKIGDDSDSLHMCPEVAKEIGDMVGEFCCDFTLAAECPLGRCRGGTKNSEPEGRGLWVGNEETEGSFRES